MIDIGDIEWRVSPGLTNYQAAVDEMEARVTAIREGRAREMVWLLEHPPLYTAGTSADPAELLAPDRFPVHRTGRGGRFTYHGPGQRIGYLMIDLEKRGREVRRFICGLEHWLVAALADLGIAGRQEPGRVGTWVGHGPDEAKIAAIGVRVRRWVTMHGFSVNVSPDLSHFSGIVPCGLSEFGVTSLEKLGVDNAMPRLDAALLAHFPAFLDEISRPPACQLEQPVDAPYDPSST